MKGRTKWFPRHIQPVRNGEYECRVRLIGGFLGTTKLMWDGGGFLTELPLQVHYWRGLTRQAFINGDKS